MNNHQVRALRATIPAVITGDDRKSTLRRLKRRFLATPGPQRAAFLVNEKNAADRVARSMTAMQESAESNAAVV